MFRYNQIQYKYQISMTTLTKCEHQAQQIMLCITQNCQYDSPYMCPLCLHDHQTLILKKIIYFQQRIKPFFEIIQKRNCLKQKIGKKYEEKRLKALQQIQKQEMVSLDKLNNIANQQLIQSISNLSSFKFVKINEIKEIFNDRICSKDRIDIIDDLCLFQNQLENCDNYLQNTREVKRVLFHPSVDNPTKKIHLNQSDIWENSNTNNNRNIINTGLNQKDSKLFQEIQNMNFEEDTQDQFNTKIFGSFDEAKLFIENKLNQTATVSIRFKFKKLSQNRNYRKNIQQFIQALKNLQTTSLLNIQIDKQCPLALWNIKKIDQNCSILPSLHEFRLKYYYYINSDVNLYEFQKLKQKLKGNIQISAICCPKLSEY